MHYLIDGYNLLFRVLKKTRDLERSRQALIEELNEAVVALNAPVTLVFDGAKDSLPPTLRRHFKAIELVYTTSGQSADTYILEEVELARNPKALTVVSNDRELQTKCRNVGTEQLSIDAFLHFLLRKKNKKLQEPEREYPFTESKKELDRLLTLFEERLKEEQL
jgi:hypothetical protein